MTSATPPDAVLFTAPGCPHCQAVKTHFEQLKGEGLLGEVTVLDASIERQAAQTHGVRSVPWYRIGEFEFDGQMSLGELRAWATRAASPDGLKAYFFDMLKTGQRAKVERLIHADPARSIVLAELAFDAEAGMETRLGVGAVLEELQGTRLTEPMVDFLAARLAETDPRQRADAAHFLSLIGGDAALAALRPWCDDADPDVREIAREACAP